MQAKKRIITCSDGTWNKPGATDRGKPVCTNVEKMFRSICTTGSDVQGNSIRQVKIYDQGVGTGYSFWDKISGGAAGAGIDKNIKDVYTFICLNYVPGDEIFLFGFSRGAYTARSVGGFIRNCGVLKPENIHLLDKAYELYRDRNEYSNPGSDMMTCWRKNYCHEESTAIYFIGVWDTVGSLGIPLGIFSSLNKAKYKFHDTTLSSHVQHAYHAVALDDRRKAFEATLWKKSDTVLNDQQHSQKLEQRWFAGVHSNIGGGYVDVGLSDLALSWLVRKSADAGLCFYQPLPEELKCNARGELRKAYSPAYWYALPIWRKVDLDDPASNQTIDESVWERWKILPNYRPGNLKEIAGKYLK